jgi:hypothetical protein
MSQTGHSLQVRPRPLVHKCPLCINTDRKFWALGLSRCANSGCEQSQQGSPYSITSSARASSVGRNREAERFGGLEIDQKLDVSRKFHRQVARFGAFSVKKCAPVGRWDSFVHVST